jgi:hypothetical protein
MARDQILVDLYNAHTGPFPRGLAGEVFGGVDLILLDEGIAGVASHYLDNARPLTHEHRADLAMSLAQLDAIDARLPDDSARVYFGRLRDLARYLTETR